MDALPAVRHSLNDVLVMSSDTVDQWAPVLQLRQLWSPDVSSSVLSNRYWMASEVPPLLLPRLAAHLPLLYGLKLPDGGLLTVSSSGSYRFRSLHTLHANIIDPIMLARLADVPTLRSLALIAGPALFGAVCQLSPTVVVQHLAQVHPLASFFSFSCWVVKASSEDLIKQKF